MQLTSYFASRPLIYPPHEGDFFMVSSKNIDELKLVHEDLLTTRLKQILSIC
jgi:hypothetical protein